MFQFTTPVAVDPGAVSAPVGKGADGVVSFGNPMVTITETPVFGTKDASRFAGQATSQGDGAWPGGHASEQVQPATLAGVDSFAPLNDGRDAILTIATGSSGQNPAPDTALSDNSGLADEPMPGPGSQYPQSMPVVGPQSVAPGAQGTGQYVPPLKSAGDRVMGNSSTVQSSIAFGAGRVGCGTGASAGAESQDIGLPEESTFPAPGVVNRVAWIDGQTSEQANDPRTWSVSSDIPTTSSPGPRMGSTYQNPGMQDV